MAGEPPEDDGWQHEIKYEGYRTLTAIEGEQAHAFTPNGHDWTEKYHLLVTAATRLRKPMILDGEVVVQDNHGRVDYGALRSAITNHPDRLIFYAFDLLSLGGKDLRPSPLMERRGQLEDLIGGNAPGNGIVMLDAADALGLEGIVSKKLTSRYRSGRTHSWLKVKCWTEGRSSSSARSELMGRRPRCWRSRRQTG
jgi:ATP-dependent DNA ligase